MELANDKSILNYCSGENIKSSLSQNLLFGLKAIINDLQNRTQKKFNGEICLTLTLLTLIVEIEAVIHTRPIAYAGSNFNNQQLK